MATDYSPPEHQRRVDELFAHAGASGSAAKPSIFKAAPSRPEPSSNPLDHRIAEELEAIRRRLDMLEDLLSKDSVLLHRHATSLQSVDLLNQMLGHLANVVAAEDKPAAVERVTLQDLRARLSRRPLKGICG